MLDGVENRAEWVMAVNGCIRFLEEDWDELKEILPFLEDSFNEWKVRSDRNLERMRIYELDFVEVVVRPDEISEFCERRGRDPSSQELVTFVNLKALESRGLGTEGRVSHFSMFGPK
jgi:hypothetical protein